MSNYLSIIKKLERGMELCGVCGREITNTSDCIHHRKYFSTLLNTDQMILKRDYRGAAVMKTYKGSHGHLLGSMYLNIRLGMECLLDIPYLRSLPLCDPDLTLVRRDRYPAFIREEEEPDVD